MTVLHRFCCCLLLLPALALPAQDPFFTHFTGNEALFNPAMTGTLGATTFTLKNKQQWQQAGHNGYQTSAVVYEESMPCSMFDYGFSFVRDQEGQGLLKTMKMGGMLAAYVPLGRGVKSVRPADLRIGTGLHWGQQSIDFSRLTFIDQLHPKYGRVGPNQQAILSSFVAPNGGRSDWYFQPSIGFNLRGIVLAKRDNPVFGSIGGAVHNLVPLVGQQGQNWSLLGLGTSTIPRYSFHAEAEAVIKEFDRKNFLSLQPRFAGQVQGPLSYFEAGVDVGFSQRLSAGITYHTTQTNAEGEPATNWASLHLQTGIFSFPGQRLDIGFSYNFNMSGLRNFVGNTLEFTARWSLATSTICRIRGQKASYDGSDALQCPTARGGRGRDKIYENIWHKTDVLDKGAKPE